MTRNEFEFCNLNDNKLDIRSVKVLSKSEYDGLQYILNKHEIEQKVIEDEKKKKAEMKEKNAAMVANWKNTHKGARDARIKKFMDMKEVAEIERKKVDEAEAEYSAKKRQEAIAEAKEALRLSEVLKERDLQVELKNLREQCEKDKDKKYREFEEKKRQQEDLKAQEAAAERKRKIMETTDFLKQQMKEHQEADKQEHELNMKEGSEIRRMAMEAELKQKQQLQLQEITKQHTAMRLKKQMHSKQKLEELERLIDVETDEQCRLFGLAKRRMLKKRINREKELFDEKLKRLDKIGNELYQYQQKRTADIEASVKNSMEETAAREKARVLEDTEKRKKTLEEIAEYRKMKIKEKQDIEQKQKEEDRFILARRKEADKKLEEAEFIRRQKNTEYKKQLGREYLEEAEFKKIHGSELEIEGQEMEKQLRCKYVNQERVFQDYAKRMIEFCKANGRNVYPLYKAKALPSDYAQLPIFDEYKDPSELQPIKKKIEPTAQRLGFIWPKKCDE